MIHYMVGKMTAGKVMYLRPNGAWTRYKTSAAVYSPEQSQEKAREVGGWVVTKVLRQY